MSSVLLPGLSGPILTPRLEVREIRGSDLVDLMEVNGDPEVTRFLPYPTWQKAEDALAWLKRMQALRDAGTGLQLVLVRRTDCKVVGTVLLFRFDPGSARLEIGYVLARACWGQGLMREALTATCREAFTQLGIRRIEAEVNPDNAASNKLLGSLGFVREGTLRQRWVGKGVAYDTYIYGLLASESALGVPG